MLNLSATQLSLICFAIFGIVVFFAYSISPKKYKWISLLVGSYALAFVLSSYWIFLLIVTTSSVYGCALWISKQNALFQAQKEGLEKEERKALKKRFTTKKKIILLAGVFFNLLIWVLLKYCNLPIYKINNHFQNNFFVSIAFPILGISYYTLQAIGYLVDVYRGKYEADKNYFRLSLFLGYFPQLIEGPIGRYDDLAPQLYEGRPFNYTQTAHGIQLFLWGLFKKIVIADRINIIVSEVYSNYSAYSGGIIFLTAILYAFQLYTDFSGYIDMATGISQMFGIKLAKNFDRPFFSQSISEFWRRWHISLGGWLRDYIFYPISFSKGYMALNKKMHGKVKPFFEKFVASALPLLFVWLACGVWHGSGVQFIVYGMYYYVIMLIGMLLEPVYTKLLEKLHINKDTAWLQGLRVIRTFLLVCLGFMIFRADSLSQFGHMFVQLFKGGEWKIVSAGVIDLYDFVAIFVSIAVLMFIEVLQARGIHIREKVETFNTPLRWTIWIGLILSILIFGAYGLGYSQVAPMYALY